MPFKGDFALLMPSVLNMALFFVFALATIPLGKFLLAKYKVPGLSQLAAAI